jgi:SAM-dependent methyltransferase
MNQAVFDRIAAYYNSLVGEFGHSPRACDYGNPRSQLAKFEVLAQVAPLTGKRILDVGCGFADFADFLIARYGELEYTGVDISPAMIQAARALHPGAPNVTLRLANILEDDPGQFDVVTANGIFYLLGDCAPDLMKRLVSRMFEIATTAVAFNSLTSWAADQEQGEFYADPCATVDFCRTLTSRLTLRHDYHTRDFTLYLYK